MAATAHTVSSQELRHEQVRTANGVVEGVVSADGKVRTFKGIPFAVPYDKIKQPVPKSVQKIRGKLNVPRERFWLTSDGQYCVAKPFDNKMRIRLDTQTF